MLFVLICFFVVVIVFKNLFLVIVLFFGLFGC